MLQLVGFGQNVFDVWAYMIPVELSAVLVRRQGDFYVLRLDYTLSREVDRVRGPCLVSVCASRKLREQR